MAVITNNTFLDGGTARTAGEVRTMNGAVLTIRTDTRRHSNAPAGLLGSIGNTTVSATLGGGVLIDSSNVRWMPYNTGTGTVPAIGTTITQGGVSGYLLGVWASYTSAPSTVGGAMPTSGYIKFREVTGGTFSIGALTGIGANATAPDRQGRIEVVQDQLANNTVPRLGFFRTRGGWFELDQVTSGSANQIIQTPTNGGGIGTHTPAIWIETAPGSGIYDKYPAILGTWFLAANLGTDDRSKFVQTLGNGQLRIGFDGTANAGYVPPAGCKIRIPSNIGRQTTSTNRTLNLVPNDTLTIRPDFSTNAAGVIDFEYFINDWYHGFSSAFNVIVKNSATFDMHNSTNEGSPGIIENYCTGSYNGTSISLTLTNNSLGGIIKDCKIYRAVAVANGHPLAINQCSNYEIQGDNDFGVIQFGRLSSSFARFSECRNIKQTGVFRINNCNINFLTSSNCDFEGVRYVDKIRGTTDTVNPYYAISTVASCNNIIIRNVDFGGYTDVHPYLGVYNSSSCSNCFVRNGGTFLSPIGGTTNAPGLIYGDGGNNDNIKVQNIFLLNTRLNNITTSQTSKNLTFERTSGTLTGTGIQILSANTLFKGGRGVANSITAGSSVYGSHTFDMFESGTDIAGRIWWAMNEPTASTLQFVTLTLTGAVGGFTSGGQVSLQLVGDRIEIETPYYILGHTALANIAPTLTGTNTGNFLYEYDIDTGTGFTGTYKTLNGANLSGETISPTIGFKLRMRATCTVANNTNALTYVRINTVTTALAQQNCEYPLDLAKITLTGYELGTRIQIYDIDNTTELYNGIPSSTTLVYEAPYVSDTTVRIRAMYADSTTAKMFEEFEDTLTIAGLNRTIDQTDDQVYIDNAIDGFSVVGIDIDDTALLVNVEDGTFTRGDIYAYETAWLTTEEGIRDEARFITAIDSVNYVFEDFKIKNVSSPSLPLIITGGWGRDKVTNESITLIDTTGGTIFSNPDLVIKVTTGSGLSPSQETTLNKINSIKPDLTIINNNVIKGSKIIPASEQLTV